MNGWLDYDYIIVSEPDVSECPALNSQVMSRIALSPRRQCVAITSANALLIALDDAKGLVLTGDADLFDFDGNRPEFDDWMADHHPDIGYRWVDQCVVSFADRAAQLAFNRDLGERVLRSDYLPRTV